MVLFSRHKHGRSSPFKSGVRRLPGVELPHNGSARSHAKGLRVADVEQGAATRSCGLSVSAERSPLGRASWQERTLAI